MGTTDLINITGSMCPSESEDEFNTWYDEVHIPVNMRFEGLVGVTRYELVRYSDWASERTYPRYLTTYRFTDMKAFRDWNVSPELAEASEGVPKMMTRLGIEMVWRAQYEFIKSWKRPSPLSVITFLGSDSSPEGEAEYDRWYSESHIPHLLDVDGLEGVERYRLAGHTAMGVKQVRGLASKLSTYPKFFTIYYFPDTAAADAYDVSPVRAREIENSQEMIRRASISQIWRAQYAPLKTWG